MKNEECARKVEYKVGYPTDQTNEGMCCNCVVETFLKLRHL
eukprot:SAG22_NODE_12856_length_427_cov_0.640244_1_plen_40_part_10